MGFKKFDGSTWQPITPKKLKGMPYTGTLPATLTGTKAGYLHRYKIYGNTEQTGTPTPDNPIMPQECGERTENLFDEEYGTITASIKYLPIYVGSGDFTLSTTAPLVNNTSALLFFLSGNVSSGAGPINNTYAGNPRTKTAIDGYVTIAYREVSSYKPNMYQTMLVSGSTAPSNYIPHGYKLPLTSAGQNVDIYLGESQTTRRIGKFDLSQATWEPSGVPGMLRTTNIPNIKYTSSNLELGNGLAEKYQIHIGSGMSAAVNCIAIDTAQVSVNTGNSFIKPTGMFYYALAEPETAVVNEPLRKIGDYADTIDSTQTSVQIPTSTGSTTISWAGEGLAPSEFDSIQEWVDIPTYTYTNGAWVLKKWSYIKALVNAGVHQQYFQLGDQLTCTRGNNTIVWDIVDMTATDMTLLMHDCPFNLQYDSVEAMFAFDGGLAAGTYHFTIINQPWYAGDVGKVVQFTLTEPIPAGGQLVVQNNSSATMIGAKINSYASGSSDTVIESATMSEGSDGTDLGSLTDAGDPTNGINSVQCGLRGNSRWSTSAIRQFLNSDGAEGSVWTPQTPFDRLPSWASSQAGFKNGLEADFLSAITPNTNTTVLNTVSDGGGVETTTDMFYLPSRTEIYGTNEISGSPEGSQYDYYIGTDNDAKIKRWNNSAVNWWLRTPISSSANLVRVVNTSGAATNYNALNTIRVAAACVIRAENA